MAQMHIKKVRKGINKAYLKVKPNRSDIDLFKANLIQLLDHTNEVESEEFHKNLVADFLKKTYYAPNHFINTKGRNDLVIHNQKKPKSSVGVIIEAKKPTNKAEMLSQDNINLKAFHELILYYLRERIAKKNLEIKYLIATNIYEWFVFDANVFEKLFAQNKALVKQFEDFEVGRLSGTNTDFFYNEIAKPFVAQLTKAVELTYVDLRKYEKPLRNDDKKDDAKLIALFKLFSPEHLLKLPFANDSNSLDKKFYTELLHLIGLEETKEKGKKVIGRSLKTNRNSGSILENTITQLESLDKLSRLSNPSQYGSTKDERLFNIGLELCISWVNRILFLKLLEAQLVTYHGGDSSYSFLNLKRIKDFDELNTLFFQVLARKHKVRSQEISVAFGKVPYLNSSLFEPTDLEHQMLFISNLRDGRTIPIHSNTVLKSDTGKKRTGELDSIEYLFAFLDAYDFSSEGSEVIQEDNKTLINASVLGLIFEKINGYKDGSFFTPGFITMYMCRETIRRAVVQKFNEAKGWKCENLDDLYDKIEDRNEANDLVNSIKICDPAVGSGHFLVSALNEIIAIKSDLKILQDREGKRLKEYAMEVVNDELIVTDDDGELFEYHFASKESQRVQESLFHEKQTIIENCLFGVDINPNSVKICRLRLWIELLKSAYYKNETELETLPNIDINIKCGNSLISRFTLDADLKDALKNSKWSIDSYRVAVDTYRNAENKEQKRKMERLIEDIKSDFRSEINKNDPKVLRLKKLSDELVKHTTQTSMFEQTPKEKKEWKKTTEKLTAQIKKLETEIEEIKSNKIYENAFEWRFEFPEVLNNKGDFVGFDVVIGNPPYVQLQSIKEVSKQLKEFGYETYTSMGDLYALFYERGNTVLKQNGSLCYISGSAWMRTNYGLNLRTFFNTKTSLIQIIDLSDCDIFDSATVLTSIVLFEKSSNNNPIKAIRFTKKDQERLIDLENVFDNEHTLIESFPDSSWIITDKLTHEIRDKVEKQGKVLSKWEVNIFRGILTGFNKAFIIDKKTRDKLIKEDEKSAELLKPMLRGRDVQRYYYEHSDLYLIATFPSLNLDIEEYPAIKNHLSEYLPKIKQTGESFINSEGKKEKTRKKTSGKWFETQDSIAYWENFNDDKIIYPNMTKFLPFTLDKEGSYTNQKCFILSGKHLHFLVAFFNSKLFKLCFEESFPELQGNTRELNKVIFETIPVKAPNNENPFIEKVDQILALKKADPEADTSALEAEIDQMVYKLYGLTEEEINLVEESVG